MLPPLTRARLAAWLAPRGASYGEVIVALALNVPFLLIALSRFPQNLQWASFAGLYAVLVFVGYYVLALYGLLTLAFLVTGAWRRLFLGASTAILTVMLFFLTVDGVVYRVAKMHIDAFWLQYLFTTFEGIGIAPAQIAGAVLLLAVIVALELFLLRVARRIVRRGLWSAGLAGACLVSFAFTQTVHVAAYEVNDTRFTWLTPQLPFYFPVTSHENALKYGNHLAMVRELDADEQQGGESLRYPLGEVGCRPHEIERRRNVLVLMLESWRADALDSVVAPQMSAFAGRSSHFLQHYSSGNSTRSGVFPLFYGIHPTYWTAIKANNVRIHNPVLIDAFEQNGYALGIFAKSHFKRHKIKDAVFRDVPVEEDFAGTTQDANDRDMTARLLAFMTEQQKAKKPFFGYAFYKSTHFPYDYPADSAPFKPAAELSVIGASASDDPTPVRNDYHNAVHYVDGLIGGLLERMRVTGLLDSTIVVITGDHGEQFNDRRDNSWGHGGDFTRWLTRVPLVVYVPGRPARRVDAVSSEVDVAPTLLQEALGCGWSARDYSNGVNLFGPLPAHRPIVVASYVNHALIVGNEVFVSGSTFVERYDLEGKKSVAGWPDARMMQMAVEEMTRFYGATKSSGLAAGPGAHGAGEAGVQAAP